MKCPCCHKETDFSLYETADDYQDGIVECNNCGEQIAVYNWSVIIPDKQNPSGFTMRSKNIFMS
jgi:hypothetical protein